MAMERLYERSFRAARPGWWRRWRPSRPACVLGPGSSNKGHRSPFSSACDVRRHVVRMLVKAGREFHVGSPQRRIIQADMANAL